LNACASGWIHASRRLPNAAARHWARTVTRAVCGVAQPRESCGTASRYRPHQLIRISASLLWGVFHAGRAGLHVISASYLPSPFLCPLPSNQPCAALLHQVLSTPGISELSQAPVPLATNSRTTTKMAYMLYSLFLAVLVLATGMSRTGLRSPCADDHHSGLLHPAPLDPSPAHPGADLYASPYFVPRRHRGWTVFLGVRSEQQC